MGMLIKIISQQKIVLHSSLYPGHVKQTLVGIIYIYIFQLKISLQSLFLNAFVFIYNITIIIFILKSRHKGENGLFVNTRGE